MLGITHAAPPVWGVVAVQLMIGAPARHYLRGGARGLPLLRAELYTLLLAVAPGGMVEMTAVVYALGIEVALAITCQVVRIFTVLTAAPLISRLLTRRGNPAA